MLYNVTAKSLICLLGLLYLEALRIASGTRRRENLKERNKKSEENEVKIRLLAQKIRRRVRKI